MSSVDIYSILSSKPHNPHYLNRYWKFIQTRIENYSEYTEIHHICPKSKDLFPEYNSFKTNPWNKIVLSAREHFIAHWLLYKTYGKSQSYAFKCMCDGQKTKYQQDRYSKVSSRVYENLKQITQKSHSASKTGKASYYDKDKNIVFCSTTDPRVLSGELISMSKGRKLPRKNKTNYNYESNARRFPNKKVVLYFLDIRIEMLYHSPQLIEMLDQGWSMNVTKEYRSLLSRRSNANRSKESRIKAGKSISKTFSEKEYVYSPYTVDKRKKMRKSDDKWVGLYYNILTKEFVEMDALDVTEDYIKVFTKINYRVVFDIDSNKKYLNKLCPLPTGYYEELPFTKLLCYNVLLNIIEEIYYKDYNTSTYIKLHIPNGGRIKYVLTNGSAIYLNKKFIEIYGVPDNCSKP